MPRPAVVAAPGMETTDVRSSGPWSIAVGGAAEAAGAGIDGARAVASQPAGTGEPTAGGDGTGVAGLELGVACGASGSLRAGGSGVCSVGV